MSVYPKGIKLMEIRFTIERFGLVKITHANLAAALTETAELRNADIVGSIRNDGWSLYVFEKGWYENNLSRIELVAIWAECNGYGLA
jgi:hypothetical protein